MARPCQNTAKTGLLSCMSDCDAVGARVQSSRPSQLHDSSTEPGLEGYRPRVFWSLMSRGARTRCLDWARRSMISLLDGDRYTLTILSIFLSSMFMRLAVL